MEFNEKLQELRKNKKLTQLELATRLNITDRAVSKWENGRGLPDISLIKPLCDELNISIESIFLPEKEGAKTREVIEAIIKYQEKSD